MNSNSRSDRHTRTPAQTKRNTHIGAGGSSILVEYQRGVLEHVGRVSSTHIAGSRGVRSPTHSHRRTTEAAAMRLDHLPTLTVLPTLAPPNSAICYEHESRRSVTFRPASKDLGPES